VEGFFDKLLGLFDHATAEEFILPEQRAIVVVESDPLRLFDRLSDYRPPRQEKWIELDET
jgi:predicted Rossmann-fold nucleotide-binding protein